VFEIFGGCLKSTFFGSLKEESISEGEILHVPFLLPRIFHVASHRTLGADELLPWWNTLCPI